MHILRLTQHSTGENKYKVEITLEGGRFRQSAVSEFEFNLSPQDQESIRWYLEDYPLYRHEPAPKIADRVEKREAEIEKELFEKVIGPGKGSTKSWARFEEALQNARIKVQKEV